MFGTYLKYVHHKNQYHLTKVHKKDWPAECWLQKPIFWDSIFWFAWSEKNGLPFTVTNVSYLPWNWKGHEKFKGKKSFLNNTKKCQSFFTKQKRKILCNEFYLAWGKADWWNSIQKKNNQWSLCVQNFRKKCVITYSIVFEEIASVADKRSL